MARRDQIVQADGIVGVPAREFQHQMECAVMSSSQQRQHSAGGHKRERGSHHLRARRRWIEAAVQYLKQQATHVMLVHHRCQVAAGAAAGVKPVNRARLGLRLAS
jgi:hypothetical protein